MTGGRDKQYALGLAEALTAEGISLDLIGSNELQVPTLLQNSRVTFLNLRGDQNENAPPLRKITRVLGYYARLIRYAASATPKLFHILWNNKFESFDRTLLMIYYRALGKRVVLTVHNVNAGKRDGTDSFWNRLTLRIQYRLSQHMFVHTQRMKDELSAEYGVPDSRISVIPYGINNAVPNTGLSSVEAKRRIGMMDEDKTVLFFGNIARYKGLEYLVDAFLQLVVRDGRLRLIIAGRIKGDQSYWRGIERAIVQHDLSDRVTTRIEFIPDDQAELYFKAADVLVLPYTHIFQSGVLFLGYSFGLPVIAADVGTLKDNIIEGRTGFVFKPQDSSDLSKVIERYFKSDLFRQLAHRRADIARYANERYSWDKVAAITTHVYHELASS